MKPNKTLLSVSLAAITVSGTGQPFSLTPDRALQASFPTKEGYEYQLFSTTNFTDWSAASDRIVGCGGIESFAFKVTNNNTFYRGQEFPPDLIKRIVGVTNVFLGTASLSATQAGTLMISGMRVQSRDYTFNDYVVANYRFDLCKQVFNPVTVEVLTNVGITTHPADTTFFFKDATDPICITNSATGIAYCTQDSAISVTSTGQCFFVSLQPGQALSVRTATTSSSAQYQYVVTDPSGNQIENYGPVPAPGTFTFVPFGAFRAGRYCLQFIPLNAASFSMTLRFINANNHSTRTLVNGATYNSSLRNYLYDYDKFSVTLNLGQTLSFPNGTSGTALALYNSIGVYETSIFPGTLVFKASAADTYYVIWYNNDGGSGHTLSSTVTVTP